jgi:hypothetical protein
LATLAHWSLLDAFACQACATPNQPCPPGTLRSSGRRFRQGFPQERDKSAKRFPGATRVLTFSCFRTRKHPPRPPRHFERSREISQQVRRHSESSPQNDGVGEGLRKTPWTRRVCRLVGPSDPCRVAAA